MEMKQEQILQRENETYLTTEAVPQQPVDQTMWAQSGIDISLNRLESIQRSFIRSSELFRDKDLAMANRFFIQCLDGLERFFEAVVATKHARKLDFKQIMATENETLDAIESQLISILTNTLQLQESKDYTAISDKIEYELITNLHAWNFALKKLRISFNSNS